MPRLTQATLDRIRERIESAALQLFVQQGYAATTTRQIAKDAGITAGALYNHYQSKEALFGAVVQSYGKRLRAETGINPVPEVLDTTRFPHDIPEIAAAIKSLIESHRPYWLLWYIDVLEFGGKHFQRQLAPQVLLGASGLRQRLAELKRDDALRIDPELAFVMVYMHLFNYFLVESVFGGEGHYGVPQSQAIETIADVFLRGILPER